MGVHMGVYTGVWGSEDTKKRVLALQVGRYYKLDTKSSKINNIYKFNFIKIKTFS